MRDYKTFSGIILERYFSEKIAKEMTLSQIGSYWETGNKNEIDIVAINDFEKTALIIEVKRNADKIDMNVLREKSKLLIKNFSNYSISYKGLSMEEM